MHPIRPAQLFMTISMQHDYDMRDACFIKLSQLLANMPFKSIQLHGWSVDSLPTQLKRLRRILLSQPERLHFNFGSLDCKTIKVIYQLMQYVIATEKGLRVPVMTCECKDNEQCWQEQILALTYPDKSYTEISLRNTALLQEHVSLIALSNMPANAALKTDYFYLTQTLFQQHAVIETTAHLLVNRILLLIRHVGLQLVHQGDSHTDYLLLASTDIAELEATKCYPTFVNNIRTMCGLMMKVIEQKQPCNGGYQGFYSNEQEVQALQQQRLKVISDRLPNLPWCGEFQPTATVHDYQDIVLSQREAMPRARTA